MRDVELTAYLDYLKYIAQAKYEAEQFSKKQ